MLIGALFSLFSTFTTLAIFSAPFCFLQLVLCRCRIKAVRLAPVILFGAGFLWSCWYLGNHYNWDALLGFLVMLPCVLGLFGSGMGWFLWRRKHPGQGGDTNETR